MAKKKVPKVGSEPSGAKQPHGEPRSIKDEKPLWSFQVADLDTDACEWSWLHLKDDVAKRVLETLAEYETRSWKEIDDAFGGRDGSHKRAVEDLCGTAQKRLRDREMDDVDELFSLRISKRERLWGIRVGQVLQIMWWDPEHSVSPYKKPGS